MRGQRFSVLAILVYINSVKGAPQLKTSRDDAPQLKTRTDATPQLKTDEAAGRSIDSGAGRSKSHLGKKAVIGIACLKGLPLEK